MAQFISGRRTRLKLFTGAAGAEEEEWSPEKGVFFLRTELVSKVIGKSTTGPDKCPLQTLRVFWGRGRLRSCGQFKVSMNASMSN